MKTLAFIPARGGSAGVKKKNLKKLGEHPLLTWSLEVVKQSSYIDDIVCSTDSFEIENLCRHHDIPTTKRPISMRNGVSHPIHEIVIEYMNNLERDPDIVVLIQPTSPFLKLHQLNDVVHRLKINGNIASAQTICEVPHNYHAWNQRSFSKETGIAKWCFPDLRKIGFNKQTKPIMWKFGNVVATRANALRKEGHFADPSVGIPIELFDAFDVDTEEDFEVAERLLHSREHER
jgi:CMP-N,N'-diacetyllegionaminic acid synthase